MIPLILRLKKQAHREIAKAQDLIVEAAYTIVNNTVMHGGTAVWRCYQGNRFSEDVDVYIPKDMERIEALFDRFQQLGFSIEKKKIAENSIYSSLKLGNTLVRFEAIFKKITGHLADYETVESNFISIYALSPEEIIVEKVNTYLQRHKVRDIYDIYILLKKVQDPTKIMKKLSFLLQHFSPPSDEQDLRILILEGVVPNSEKIKEYIQIWVHKNT